MPVFAYKGLDANGKEVKGLQDAESPKSLRSVLKRDGIRIIEHKEESGDDKKKSGTKRSGGLASTEIDLKKYTDRISIAQIALVTRQLATLLRSGITLIESLTAIVDQAEGEKLKRVFGQIKSDVNEGSSLADAMATHSDVFSGLFVSMIRAGEASGALDTVLLRLANFMEQQAKLKARIMSAMMYPMIMICIGGIVLLLLFVVVIPRITKIFEQVEAQLPIQTRLLIFVADAVKNYWWALIVVTVGAVVWFRRWRKSEKGRATWDRMVLSAPVFGSVVRMVAVARFARTLATLLRSGVPVLNALEIVRDVVANDKLGCVIDDARDAIREGESIAKPIARSREFPPIVVHMIAIGEKSGQLEEMLEHVADNYDFQVDQKIDSLTSLLEPVMIVGMGVSVAYIVFAILLPILQLSQHVR